MSSLLKKAFNSATLMSWLNLSTRVLSTVLVLPLVLRNFSPSEISLWYLFSSIMIIQLLCDFGFNDSFIRVISYGLGGADKTEIGIIKESRSGNSEPNYETIELAWNTMKYVYRRLTILLLILYVTIGTIVLYKPINYLEFPHIGWYSWAVITFGACFQFYGNVYANYLQGMNKIALVNRWGSIFSILGILTSFLILVLKGGIFELIIANQSWVIVNVIRNYLLAHNIDSGRLKAFKNAIIDKQVFKSIWNSAWRSAIGVIMSNVVIQASGLIFAQIGSVKDTASYLLGFRLIQTVSSFSLPPFYSKIPYMARLRAEGDIAKLISVSQKGMRLTYFTFLAGFIIIGFSADFLLKLIGSHAEFVTPQLWILMGLGFFIERYGDMHIQLYSTTNHIIWHIANGITGSIYLLLSFVLIGYIGVYAFPLAMVISYLLFYSWYSSMHSYKSINMSFFSYEKNVILIPILIIIIYIIIRLITY